MAKPRQAAPATAANVARMMPAPGAVEHTPQADLSYLDNVVSAPPEGTVGFPVSEGNPPEQPPQEAQAEPPAQGEPGQQEQQPPAAPVPDDDGIDDDRFKGKSKADIFKAYKNLESEQGRHRNEVGEYRRFFDQFVMNQVKANAPAQANPQVDDAELLSKLLTKPSEVLQTIQQNTVAQVTQARQAELVNQIKMQNINVIRDPGFINWLRAEVPPSTVQRLDQDPGELVFVINTYKRITSAPAQAQASSPAPSAPRDIRPGVAAGTGAPTKTPAKVYTRNEIRSMIVNDNARYQHLLATGEIERAYAEGRVKN